MTLTAGTVNRNSITFPPLLCNVTILPTFKQQQIIILNTTYFKILYKKTWAIIG